MAKKKDGRFTFDMSPELRKLLKQRSKAEDRSEASICRQALNALLRFTATNPRPRAAK